LRQEADEAEKIIGPLRKRKQEAEKRLAADTAKAPKDTPQVLADPIGQKRDLVRQELDKPLNQGVCDTAEQLLDEVEKLVVEADEFVKAVAVAKSLQDLSNKALVALSEVKAPSGYGKLDVRTVLGPMLRSTAAYTPVKAVQGLVGQLFRGEPVTDRSAISNLVSQADALKKAMTDAGKEALAELQDRAEQIGDQMELYNQQGLKNLSLYNKFMDPMPFVEELMKSWPRSVPRPGGLKARLQGLIETDDVDKAQKALDNLADTEGKVKPWTDADWLGKVMPSAQALEGDLRKTLSGLNATLQKGVVDALAEEMEKVIRQENTNKGLVAAAIRGREQRGQLAGQLTGSAKIVYDELQRELENMSGGKRPNVEGQVSLANEKFANRKASLEEDQRKLGEKAQESGVEEEEPDPLQYKGKKYVLVGTHGQSTVYARLDDCPTGSGMGAFMNLYKTALSKGIIPSSSTGSEGVKYESHLGGWVVKVTLRAVAHNPGFDNTFSPLAADGAGAAQEAEPPAIYLNFNDWTQRH
jgi:hypothetical protein